MLRNPRGLLVLMVAMALLVGCAANDSHGNATGGAGFGEPCQKTEDCSSGLCVQLGSGGGICTRICGKNSGCPASPNWGCVKPSNFSSNVCACVPDAATEICGDGIDNDCNGRVDDCQTCNGQQVSLDSHDNCGSCGHKCRSDQICSVGACRCAAGSGECGGQCVDTQTSSTDCGGCGNVCNAGQSCQAGTCVCDDPTTPDYCSGSGCVDTSTDTQNCGSCGHACQVGQDCIQGQCSCPGTESYCDGSGCVDLQTDAFNCGTCGNACPGGATCWAGTCSCAVATPDVCGNTCTNLQTDAFNCGTCGNACPAGKNCINGVCSCPYLTPNDCNGTCVNLSTDKSNCGACGNVCPSAESCINGTCGCSNYYTYCGSTCVDTSNDDNNCGTCGTVCPSGQYCSYGSCVCSTYGQTPCGASCVDTSTDASNCGTCGTACPSNQVCASGTCQCPSGESWCASANKCFDLNNDASNCGTCGTVCNPGEVCSYGQCGCSTYTDKWCASANTCIDVYSDSNNCGDCGTVCPAQTHCSYASCVCDQSGYSLCGSSCFDLQNNPAHCGSCSNKCAGNQICSSGSCACPDPAVGTAVRLTTTSTATVSPAAAWDGTHVGVAYLEGNAVKFALLKPDGTRAASPDKVVGPSASGNDHAGAPDIAWNGSEYAIVWSQNTSASGDEVMLRRYAADGTAKGAAVSITANTPGTPKMTTGEPQISWSSTYGGYAVADKGSTTYTDQLLFQRVGTDGTAPDAVNPMTANSFMGNRVSIDVSPTGEWSVVYRDDSYAAYMQLYNLDGSRTQTATLLSPTTWNDPHVVWDGVTWLAAWYYQDVGAIYANRDDQNFNYQNVLASAAGDVELAMGSPGIVEMVYLASDSDLHLQRFSIPTSPTGALTSLGPDVTIPTTNMLVTSFDDWDAVHTGTGSMLVVWADSRWGAGELYAVPIDFSNCP